MIGVSLQIKGSAGLEPRADLGAAAAIDNRIDVHVTRDVAGEIRAAARQKIDHASGQIAGRKNLGESYRG